MCLLYSILYSLKHLTYVFIHSIAYRYYYTLNLLNTNIKKIVYLWHTIRVRRDMKNKSDSGKPLNKLHSLVEYSLFAG